MTCIIINGWKLAISEKQKGIAEQKQNKEQAKEKKKVVHSSMMFTSNIERQK